MDYGVRLATHEDYGVRVAPHMDYGMRVAPHVDYRVKVIAHVDYVNFATNITVNEPGHSKCDLFISRCRENIANQPGSGWPRVSGMHTDRSGPIFTQAHRGTDLAGPPRGLQTSLDCAAASLFPITCVHLPDQTRTLYVCACTCVWVLSWPPAGLCVWMIELKQLTPPTWPGM